MAEGLGIETAKPTRMPPPLLPEVKLNYSVDIAKFNSESRVPLAELNQTAVSRSEVTNR